VLRTRFIDDLVQRAINRGAGQLVLLGAGLDTRAYRIEQLASTPVFEVDEPATLSRKRERLRRALENPPAHVRYVAFDFEGGGLAGVLRTAGLSPDVPSVVVWEGVTSYLTADAVDTTLRSLAAAIAPESVVAFTYLQREVLQGQVDSPGAVAVKRAVRLAGEPFRFGLNPERVHAYVEDRGFALEADRSAADLAREYLDRAASRGLEPAFYRIAVARRVA
jgi:methyltransferase (TIGR00027 family)